MESTSRKSARALARTNFAAVYAALPGNLTVSENLRFFGMLYDVDALSARVNELLKEFDLEHLRNTKCGLLSSGEQTRAALAKALINEPILLLLDEPTASLDPSAAQIIRERIRNLAVKAAAEFSGPRTTCTKCGLPLAAFILVLFVFGITLGILAAAAVLRFGPAAEWLVWPLPALLSPFAAVFYPVSILPRWMQEIARALPPSYVFEGMRGVLSGQPFSGTSPLEGRAVAVLELSPAAFIYARVYRRAVRTGLLARYSAEGAT